MGALTYLAVGSFALTAVMMRPDFGSLIALGGNAVLLSTMVVIGRGKR